MPTGYEKLLENENCELEPYQDSIPSTPVSRFNHNAEQRPTSRTLERSTNIKDKIVKVCCAIVAIIVPSFLHGGLTKSKTSPPKKSNIATLDGLRGLSCLFVLNSHWSYALVNSYRGTTGYKNSHWFFHLPIVHLLWGGQALVDIFFVLSGYVLSRKCIQHIHACSWESFHKTIASMVIRRATRIWLPPLFSIALVFVLSRFHAFDRAHEIYLDQHYHHTYQLELREVPPTRFDSFGTHLVDCLGATLSLLDPSPILKLETFKMYNSYLWTIPLEYYCSMALYIVLLSTSRLRKTYRLAIHIFLTLFYWFTLHRFQCLFIAGMTIAELDIIWNDFVEDQNIMLQSPLRKLSSTNKTKQICQKIKDLAKAFNWITFVRTFTLLGGLWLLSVPGRAAEDTPGYQTIMKLLPSYFTWENAQDLVRAAGSIFVVWPIANVSTDSTARRSKSGREPSWWSFKSLVDVTLTNPVVHYLGQISFALYILHGVVIKSIGYSIIPSIYEYVVFDARRRESFVGFPGLEYVNGTWIKTGNVDMEVDAMNGINSTIFDNATAMQSAFYPREAGLTSLEIALIWILGYIVILPSTIWAADIFWRLIDQKCITLGHTIEKWISVESRKNTDDESQFNTPTPRMPRWRSQFGGLSRGSPMSKA